MSNSNAKKKGRIPGWAWPFAIACFAIPVVSLGGLIPGALGGGAGGYCLDHTRKAGLTVRSRATHCAMVVVSSWVVFIAFLAIVGSARTIFTRNGGDTVVTTRTVDAQGTEVVQVSRRAVSSTSDLSDESVRRDIYTMATGMTDALQDARDRRDKDRANGRDTAFAERQLAHVEGMHTQRLEFTMKFHSISREQLDEVLAEGDRMGWQRD